MLPFINSLLLMKVPMTSVPPDNEYILITFIIYRCEHWPLLAKVLPEMIGCANANRELTLPG